MKRAAALILIFFCAVCFTFAEDKIFYTDGPRTSKKIALTFDDGPGKATERILEALKEKNVKATFFMVGIQAEKNPNLAKKIFDAGHEIQSHTYSHMNFYKYAQEDKAEKMKEELLRAEKAIEENAGVKPYLVRFPYGYSRDDAKKTASENGYKMINWSFGLDWVKKLDGEDVYKKYVSNIRSGAVFLIHDLNYNEAFLSFIGDFIDEIKSRGYELVTVSEMFGFNK
ncbi:MAG: polysaccharide deacetylase family protein [Endomicrobium sp.]|jgi:peptidoglycan/xylan/chitin deacetylase (PgdA/CDA1 family)|nr:polysaccharide deacetylase family protein [Endomicrobium sp.]